MTARFDSPVEGTWLSDHFGVVVDLEIGRRHTSGSGWSRA